MSGETISRGLNDISDAYLHSAMGVYERKKRSRSNLLRVVAGAAIFVLLLAMLLWPQKEKAYITGPGILTVKAFAVDENGMPVTESENLEVGVAFRPKIAYNPTDIGRIHFPFTFSVEESLYPGMDITLQISTDAGIFYKNEPYDPNLAPDTPYILRAFAQYYGQNFTVDIDKAVYWQPNGFDYAYMQAQIESGNMDYDSAYKEHGFTKNPSFIDVIIRADAQIVGYCVIEIREVDHAPGNRVRSFRFELLRVVSFPQVNGIWQDVTLDYVQSQIDQLHRQQEKCQRS